MRYLSPFIALALFVGCVGTEATRLDSAPEDLSPVPASEVAVYSDTSSVPCSYSRVAIVQAQSISAMVSTSKLAEEVKPKAGELGANAVIISDVNESSDPGGRNGRFLALHVQPCEGESAE